MGRRMVGVVASLQTVTDESAKRASPAENLL
jgi:hypothetical protein